MHKHSTHVGYKTPTAKVAFIECFENIIYRCLLFTTREENTKHHYHHHHTTTAATTQYNVCVYLYATRINNWSKKKQRWLESCVVQSSWNVLLSWLVVLLVFTYMRKKHWIEIVWWNRVIIFIESIAHVYDDLEGKNKCSLYKHQLRTWMCMVLVCSCVSISSVLDLQLFII